VIRSDEGGWGLHERDRVEGGEPRRGRGPVGARDRSPWFRRDPSRVRAGLDAPLDHLLAEEDRPEGSCRCREAIDAILARRRTTTRANPRDPPPLGEGPAARRDRGRRRSSLCRARFSRPFVAIRSSALEEDAEAAARAGEFETFPFRARRSGGPRPSERGLERTLDRKGDPQQGRARRRSAAHRRGDHRAADGRSRVSGVVRPSTSPSPIGGRSSSTPGWDSGEGSSRGLSPPTMSWSPRRGIWLLDTVRFRYITADKRERIAFNERSGLGTARVETRYTRGLRPCSSTSGCSSWSARPHVSRTPTVTARHRIRIEDSAGSSSSRPAGSACSRRFAPRASAIPSAPSRGDEP